MFSGLHFFNNQRQMIAVDNEVINWEKEGKKTGNDKLVADGIEGLKASRKRIFFERVLDHNDMGIMITRPATVFKCVATRNNPVTKKKEKWVYTEPKLFDTDKKLYEPLTYKGGLDIDLWVANDPERAFFFFEIMRYGLGQVGYRLRDWDKEASDLNKKEYLEYELGGIVLHKLNMSDVKLRCMAYGVLTEDKGDELLRRELFNKVKQLDKDKTSTITIRKFIDEANANSPELRLKAYVHEAFRKNILIYEHLQIKYKDADVLICVVPATRTKEYVEHLVDFLSSNPEQKDIFMASVQGSIDNVGEIAVDFEAISNVAKLRSIANKYYGVSQDSMPTNMKAEEIKEMLRKL